MSGALPLEGIRVLDLSRIVAGPSCTMQLGDLGAQIIKIERPGTGDDTRRMKPPEQGGEAHFYLAFNRNKQSVAIDMKTEGGLELVDRLAARCDVLVENFRPGVTKRLGIDFEKIRERHPHLIYCSISAYGQSGPMSSRPGLDPVLQAEMGLMSLNGEPDGDPLRHPLSLTDLFASLQASTAVCAAIVHQRESGLGCHIDLSLMGSAVSMLSNMAMYSFATGANPPRMGNGFPTAAPVGAFRGSDGELFYMASGTDGLFTRLAEKVLERPGLLDDARFHTNSARVENQAALLELFRARFATNTRDHWVEKIRAAGVPAGPVRPIHEALSSPEVVEAGFVHRVEHPTAGEIPILGSPYKLSDTPARKPSSPPLLGEHTDEVLREMLDIEDAEIATLRDEGVIA